jgi:peptidyl-prolyl cis-trans isomerase A (cyclophilin A)
MIVRSVSPIPQVSDRLRRSTLVLRLLAASALGASMVIAACSSDTPAPITNGTGSDGGGGTDTPDAGGGTDSGEDTDGAQTGPAESLAGCTPDPGPPASTFDGGASTTDPIAGGAEKFTLADALAGYPDAAGTLTALITTEKSTIKCELFEAAAPISVANFVGLARGTRPYRAAGVWKVGRFYDGLLWHRVIPDFVIQGGDPAGTGSGGPGYSLVPENQVAEPLGALAQAAAAAPSGSQFYIVVGKGPAPDYNVFGNCTTAAAIAVASVPRGAGDRPKTDIHMQKIEIARCPK